MHLDITSPYKPSSRHHAPQHHTISLKTSRCLDSMQCVAAAQHHTVTYPSIAHSSSQPHTLLATLVHFTLSHLHSTRHHTRIRSPTSSSSHHLGRNPTPPQLRYHTVKPLLSRLLGVHSQGSCGTPAGAKRSHTAPLIVCCPWVFQC